MADKTLRLSGKSITGTPVCRKSRPSAGLQRGRAFAMPPATGMLRVVCFGNLLRLGQEVVLEGAGDADGDKLARVQMPGIGEQHLVVHLGRVVLAARY